jgi:hypothetical protein
MTSAASGKATALGWIDGAEKVPIRLTVLNISARIVVKTHGALERAAVVCQA